MFIGLFFGTLFFFFFGGATAREGASPVAVAWVAVLSPSFAMSKSMAFMRLIFVRERFPAAFSFNMVAFLYAALIYRT